MSPEQLITFVRKIFNEPSAFIPLHAPYFGGNEKKYVLDTIDSTFVSSVGEYVNRFERMMAEITGAKFAVATVNGTTALHLSLVASGVKYGDYVITQPLTFVATANAIAHAGAKPIFVDVDETSLSLSANALQEYLEMNSYIDDEGVCRHKLDHAAIKACMPMHTFGFVADIENIVKICSKYHLTLIEDCAESLGSYYGHTHTGNFGRCGTFSFNGNKTVTSGAGGAIITNDEHFAALLKHLSTTAKKAHPYEFFHDMVGYNYRMPNLNAALACAQLEQLPAFLKNKRDLAHKYRDLFKDTEIQFIDEAEGTKANFWLNTILMHDTTSKNLFLKATNDAGVMTRPIWHLMNHLPMYSTCYCGDLTQSEFLAEHIINLPSSYRNNG